MTAFNYILLVFDKLQCDTQTHSNDLTKYVVILKGIGHSKLKIMPSVLVTIDFHCMGKKRNWGKHEIHACEIQQKMFSGPKKVESLCCMWLYYECGGWPERKGKEWRERKRDLQHTHWQIWSVCSAGLFLAEEMGKSHAGTLQTTEKNYTL